MDITIVFALVSIPCIVTGVSVWLLHRNIDRKDKKREVQDKAREKRDLLLVQSVNAAITLCEATAEAVQRMDKNCNGKMTKALDYAITVKHELRDFLNEQGIKKLS